MRRIVRSLSNLPGDNIRGAPDLGSGYPGGRTLLSGLLEVLEGLLHAVDDVDTSGLLVGLCTAHHLTGGTGIHDMLFGAS